MRLLDTVFVFQFSIEKLENSPLENRGTKLENEKNEFSSFPTINKANWKTSFPLENSVFQFNESFLFPLYPEPISLPFLTEVPNSYHYLNL